MTNLHSILKSRDITLSTKVCLVKAMVFPVVTYGCESWTIKKVECQRIDAFELWCWKRLLRVPWTARRSNQSILKEISLGCSLEGLMLKLKLQYYGYLMQRADSFEKTLMLGKTEAGERDDRGWNGWMASLTQWTWVWVDSGSWWWTGRPGVLQFVDSQSWTRLSDWTELSDMWCGAPFHMNICHQYSLFSEISDKIRRSLAHFSIGLCSYCWVLRVLCIFWINCILSDVSFKYFLWVCGLFSHFLDTVLCWEVFNFNEVHLMIFSFMHYAFGVVSKKALPYWRSFRLSPMLSSKSFIVLWFTLRSVIHFQLIF